MPSNTSKTWLVPIAAAALIFSGIGVVNVGSHLWPSTPEPKAVITVEGHATPPTEVPANSLIMLSAEGSTAGKSPKSVSWAVEPDSGSTVARVGRQLVLAVGDKTPRIVVKLHVASGDAIDSVQVAMTVKGAKPADDPSPAPSPVPTPFPPAPTPTPSPTPDPGPSGPVDAAVRKAAADYYGALPALYLQSQSQIAATGVNYNDVHAAMKAKRDAVADALAAALDAVVLATVADDGVNWTDKPAAAQAHGVVGRSLAAGLRDAAASAPR